MTPLPQNPDVVVVGAGSAGLSAAQALRAAGQDVLVLEAAPHIGGRCITDTATFAVPFDRGGSWMHDAATNPLARKAEDIGVTLHKTSFVPRWVQIGGRDLSTAEAATYGDSYDAMWQAANANASQPDRPMAETLPDLPFVDTLMRTIPLMLAGDADVISARDTYLYDDAMGDWLPEGGYGAFLARLHGDVPVVLNCPVTRIDHSGPQVRVETPRGTVLAAQVVVTVSTAVLASGAIVFHPALPVAKQEAINALPCGLLNKIGMLFDAAWAADKAGLAADYHPGGDAFCGIYFGFCGTALATGFVGGRFADALEADGPGAASAFCRDGLRAIFGSDAEKAIVKSDETAWRSTPTALGSYSYALPGQTAARQVLAAPVGAVHFAGEAVMQDKYSTVHGAWMSGQRAAQAVLHGAVLA